MKLQNCFYPFPFPVLEIGGLGPAAPAGHMARVLITMIVLNSNDITMHFVLSKPRFLYHSHFKFSNMFPLTLRGGLGKSSKLKVAAIGFMQNLPYKFVFSPSLQ